MVNERESDYYLLIRIFNSNRAKPIFNWSQSRGNIALGIAIAKEEVQRKISPEKESHYSIMIKLRNDRDNKTVFEWNTQQGNVRNALNTADEYIQYKLGFDLVGQVKSAVKGD
jgi:signal recognition particle receptor subunit beta